ncbi:unnamed protein product [Gongylonema pulchrum]|uniref:UBX domain-containing protein 4 n=1 Tax=Gongylonema pulchrum TaxID=637853 RepID=A0A183DNG8_9BILA|nr:unnamed protein product [Gongylonema pulchrum]
MNIRKRNFVEPKQEEFAAEAQNCVAPPVSDSAVCRIQCKFPDGSALVHQFSASAPLSELIELLKKDGRHGEDFSLVQMYPRQTLSDATKTFAELGLVPSATVLVVSRTMALTFGGSRWIEFLHYAIIAPFQALYRILLYLIGYGTTGGGNASASATGSGHEDKRGTNISDINRVTTGGRRNRRGYARQEGNLTRFHNEDDSSNSDDEARWNGNSTQQL